MSKLILYLAWMMVWKIKYSWCPQGGPRYISVHRTVRIVEASGLSKDFSCHSSSTFRIFSSFFHSLWSQYFSQRLWGRKSRSLKGDTGNKVWKKYYYRQFYPQKKQSSYWETDSPPAGQETRRSTTMSIAAHHVSSLWFCSAIPHSLPAI
jgi:hypothetical protein